MLPLQELNGCITHSMQASQCMFTCNLEMQVGVRNSWIVYYITIAPVLLEYSMWKILLRRQSASYVQLEESWVALYGQLTRILRHSI